jgi:hypothetical protein
MFAKKKKKSDFRLDFFTRNRYTNNIEAHGVGNNPLPLKKFFQYSLLFLSLFVIVARIDTPVV